MSSRLWIDEGPRWWSRGAVASLIAGCAAIVIGTVLWRDGVLGSAPPRVVPAAPWHAPATVDRPALAPSVVAVASERTSSATPVNCAYQRLQLAFADGAPTVACVGATRVVLNGDVRSLIVEPDGTSAWSLKVDMADNDVIAVSASAPGRGDYRCENADCAGATLSPRDAQGRRRLVLKDTALVVDVPVVEGATLPTAHATPTLRLGTTLALPADREDARQACKDGDGLSIVESRGASFALCPKEAAAEGDAEGKRTFEFAGTEGDRLFVDLGADGTIERVQLGALRCRREACSGVATQAGAVAGSEAGRSFTFFGLTVADGNERGASATLTGRLVVPPI